MREETFDRFVKAICKMARENEELRRKYDCALDEGIEMSNNLVKANEKIDRLEHELDTWRRSAKSL